jgi:hypothetical protein
MALVMGRRHYSDEIERRAVVFYLPGAHGFWTGRKSPAGPLRKAQVFHFRVPPPPPGAVPMLRRRARKMLDHHEHERYDRYIQTDEPALLRQKGKLSRPSSQRSWPS